MLFFQSLSLNPSTFREEPISFTIPWACWIIMNLNGLYGSNIYMIISALLMWLPGVSAAFLRLIKKEPMIKFSWKPSIRKHLKLYLTAWLVPVILTFLSCAVYFLVFRNDFSLQNIETIALPLPLFLLFTVIVILLGAVFNMFFALGEETGWRGFLYPELSRRFSRSKACIITGMIWGFWHTPINIMGYNYGLRYQGYPITGIAAMCLSCIVLGTWCSYLAESTNSIWAPALFHGTINAVGASGLIFMEPNTSYLLGPGITGVIPSIIVGLCLIPFIHEKRGRDD